MRFALVRYSVVAVVLVAAAAAAVAQPPRGRVRPSQRAQRAARRPQLTPPARVRTTRALLRAYRKQAVVGRGERLRFRGVGGRDVYNPTRPFVIGGRRVMAGRVESRGSETDSKVVFFERRGGAWHPVPDAPVLALQDPFVSELAGTTVVGGVEVVRRRGGGTRYRTVFYRGSSLSGLTRFAQGPWGMKDVRLAPLDDGRVLVLTRPQGTRGGRGKIGYTIARSLDAITPQLIARAPIIEGQFTDLEWGGANEVIPLGKDRFGVLGHIARFDARGGRHYYPISFELDLAGRRVSEAAILAERRDLPGGLRGATKRRDLKDVLFSGGLERDGRGRATLYLGAGDAETYRVDIADPFAAHAGR